MSTIKYLNKLFSYSLVIISGIVFFINFWNRSLDIIQIIKLIPTSVTITSIVSVIYIKYLWKYDPFHNIPKLKKEYKGYIKYNHEKGEGTKEVTVVIKQTALKTFVEIRTDEITSNSITSDIVIENDATILYYTYITSPKSMYEENNPIKRGTCRIEIENNNLTAGKYWTSVRTVGDIIIDSN